MDIQILASGSDGNCISVRSDSTTILIDAGIAKNRIERRLMEVGIRPDRIDAIFITHAHKDHIQGLSIANKYRIPVFATESEWRNILGLDESLQRIIIKHRGGYDPIRLEVGVLVAPFRTHHDACEPVGYMITGSHKVSICLDTGHIDGEMLEIMRDSDIYIMESNHDPDLVVISDYPDRVKARILSDTGHLSNQQVADALTKLIVGKGERIYLIHLSSTNNIPELAKSTVEMALRRRGYRNGQHYHLEVI